MNVSFVKVFPCQILHYTVRPVLAYLVSQMIFHYMHTILSCTVYCVDVLDLFSCIECRMTPVATATFSELNVMGKSRHGGIVIIAVHCRLTASLSPDPSLPTMNICM